MSEAYRKEFGDPGVPTTDVAMRLFCQRPGRVDKDGRPLYRTEQGHKAECDVNNIVRKFDKTGLLTHVSKFEADYGDLRGIDFKNAMDLVLQSKKSFDGLPAAIKKRFRNSPEDLLRFMEDPSNRDEAIKLGLIRPDVAADKDGLGEHVKDGVVVKPK